MSGFWIPQVNVLYCPSYEYNIPGHPYWDVRSFVRKSRKVIVALHVKTAVCCHGYFLPGLRPGLRSALARLYSVVIVLY